MNLYDLKPLFEDIQLSGVFPDGKTFVDCIPKRNPEEILADYNSKKNSPSGSFSLKKFVENNFILPPFLDDGYISNEIDIAEHISNLWSHLKREHDETTASSSLLSLPNPYIVPGGRFREVYYWDSYFTMLGLKESGETEMIKNMIDNFAYLIHTYGHIPNGNRSYYLSRSQPPFFTLMVELYASVTGNSVFENYSGAMEREYAYWMDGYKEISNDTVNKKLVCLPDGSILNRYFDELFTPRPESWAEDVETAGKSNQQNEIVYNHLRSAAESGWDFSSRWLAYDYDLSSIETTNIIPVDLNALLYHTEISLAGYFKKCGDDEKLLFYNERAGKRYAAIQKYLLNKDDNIYYDYHWKQKKQTGKFTPASFFPLWLSVFPLNKAQHYGNAAAEKLKAELLKEGGVLTTIITNGQQWDAPNGWPPLQWVVVQALEKTNQQELAADIAKRWIKLNNHVYQRTGKLMEKYNVVDTHLEAGGGEYPGQDGFGWTNGVLLALITKYGKPGL
jgi:alpha,alpha-trehalase